ncbi:hypothetical protein MRB53_017206 [Persea americana]|uniref:Uncharacterized protein n=1 Tax=Persea americana TaxID=3435 RepID=A0ACC2M412_PERAE|nr:hypothetical protein MRB53_017206 [Persea americana]
MNSNQLISIDPIGCSVLQNDEILSTSSSTVTGFFFCKTVMPSPPGGPARMLQSHIDCKMLKGRRRW